MLETTNIAVAFTRWMTTVEVILLSGFFLVMILDCLRHLRACELLVAEKDQKTSDAHFLDFAREKLRFARVNYLIQFGLALCNGILLWLAFWENRFGGIAISFLGAAIALWFTYIFAKDACLYAEAIAEIKRRIQIRETIS